MFFCNSNTTICCQTLVYVEIPGSAVSTHTLDTNESFKSTNILRTIFFSFYPDYFTLFPQSYHFPQVLWTIKQLYIAESASKSKFSIFNISLFKFCFCSKRFRLPNRISMFEISFISSTSKGLTQVSCSCRLISDDFILTLQCNWLTSVLMACGKLWEALLKWFINFTGITFEKLLLNRSFVCHPSLDSVIEFKIRVLEFQRIDENSHREW